MTDNNKYRETINLSNKVYLTSTSYYLKKLSNPISFTVESEIPSLNNRKIEIVKWERCFSFKSDRFNLVNNMVQCQGIGHGLGNFY